MNYRSKASRIVTQFGILSLLLLRPLVGSAETIYAIVHGDTVTIWSRNAEVVCGSLYRFDVRTSNDTVTVCQVDTASSHSTCMCFVQLSVSLTGLQTGHYVVPVYRTDYVPDTLKLVGFTEFTIDSSSTSAIQLSYQSLCSQTPQSVRDWRSRPERFALHQCFPNPFNPSTTIVLEVPERSHVKLDVYDVLGRTVAVLIDEVLSPGIHERTMNATNISSGTYFCRLSADGFVQVQRMLLQK